MTKDEIINFSMEIEELVWQKDIPYMDAILLYCETTGLEIETAAKLISNPLKSKLKVEAENLHMLVKENTGKLPI